MNKIHVLMQIWPATFAILPAFFAGIVYGIEWARMTRKAIYPALCVLFILISLTLVLISMGEYHIK